MRACRKKTLKASRERVFEAWTKPEIMQKWFFPGDWSANVTTDFRVGGSYSIDMISNGSSGPCQPNADDCKSENQLHTGEYVEIKAPEKLVFTWNSSIVSNTRVTVELRDLGSETELTLTHERYDYADLKECHNQGWDGCLANLENVL